VLLERERQLERLRQSIAETVAGSGGVVLIEGPAGIGKTALLPLRFIHPLLRRAVYEGILPATRADSHRRAGLLLAAEGVHSTLAAAHLLRSDPADDPPLWRRFARPLAKRSQMEPRLRPSGSCGAP
jgi:AAA ATPase domain